jgi:hypothetical protein
MRPKPTSASVLPQLHRDDQAVDVVYPRKQPPVVQRRGRALHDHLATGIAHHLKRLCAARDGPGGHQYLADCHDASIELP